MLLDTLINAHCPDLLVVLVAVGNPVLDLIDEGVGTVPSPPVQLQCIIRYLLQHETCWYRRGGGCSREGHMIRPLPLSAYRKSSNLEGVFCVWLQSCDSMCHCITTEHFMEPEIERMCLILSVASSSNSCHLYFRISIRGNSLIQGPKRSKAM